MKRSGLIESPITTGIVEQGLASVVFTRQDFTDEDLVITPRKNIYDLAVEVRKTIRQDWRSGCAAYGTQV